MFNFLSLRTALNTGCLSFEEFLLNCFKVLNKFIYLSTIHLSPELPKIIGEFIQNSAKWKSSQASLMLRRAAQELIVETQDGNSSASCNKIIMIICIILGVSVMHLFNDHYKQGYYSSERSDPARK